MSSANCPVCHSADTSVFLRRTGVPAHQNYLIPDQASAENALRGDLTLAVCGECGFIFNRTFELSKTGYGAQYDNTQTYSPFFSRYIDGLVRHLIHEKNTRDCRIIEIGCGKGEFLKKLIEADSLNSGGGFDPSYTGPETGVNGRVRFERHFYGPQDAVPDTDVVICRHVIEHVPDPAAFLKTLRKGLAGSPHVRIFFETPCVEWILRNHAIWDFFYEHCSYFSVDSLTTVFEEAGFKVGSVERVFEGQYLWLEAVLSSGETATRKAGVIPSLAEEFAVTEEEYRRVLTERMESLSAQGGVAFWGAGAKGATLANLIDPHRTRIACVADLNPQKQSHYIPGSGHPIIAPGELSGRGVKTAVLMNPNYREECSSLIREGGWDIDLADLTDLELRKARHE